MKTLIYVGLTALLASTSLTFASPSVIPIDQLCEQEASVFLTEGWGESILEVSGGLKIPLQFYFEGDLIELNQGLDQTSILDIKQSFYIKYTEEGHLFSLDLQNWSGLEAFIGGNLAVHLDISEGNPILRIGGEVHSR